MTLVNYVENDNISVLDIASEALDLWGVDAQLDIATEECAELIQAISKFKRWKNFKQGDYQPILENLREEMADVQIMITQLAFMFDNIACYRTEEKKWLRLLSRLRKSGAIFISRKQTKEEK